MLGGIIGFTVGNILEYEAVNAESEWVSSAIVLDMTCSIEDRY